MIHLDCPYSQMNLASRCRDATARANLFKAELKACKLRMRQQQQLGLAGAVDGSDTISLSTSASGSPKSDEDTLLHSNYQHRPRSSHRNQHAEEKKSDTTDLAVTARHLQAVVDHPPVHSPTQKASRLLANRKITNVAEELERMDRILAEHAKRTSSSSLMMPATTTTTTEEPNGGTVSDDGHRAILSDLQQPLETTREDDDDDDEEDARSAAAQHDEHVYPARDDLDQIASPSLQQRRSNRKYGPPLTTTLVSSDDFDEDVVAAAEDGYAVEETVSPTELGDESAAAVWDTKFSTTPSHFKFYDEEYPQDIVSTHHARSSSKDADYYHQQHYSKLGEVKEEDTVLSNGERGHNDGGTSSIDAFEASFSIAAFPKSFSPKELREQEIRENDLADSSDTSNHLRTRPQALAISPTKAREPYRRRSPTEPKAPLHVYDPFLNSPQDNSGPLHRPTLKLSKSSQPPTIQLNQSLPQPLPLKWGTRARDRARSSVIESPGSGSLNGAVLTSSSGEQIQSPTYAPTIARKFRSSPPSDNKRKELSGLSPTSISSPGAPMDEDQFVAGSSSPKDKRSPLTASWDGVRSVLPFQKTSPRHKLTWQEEPSTPTATSPMGSQPDAYSTPPSSAASSSFHSSGSSRDPYRPKKAGYDAARARYEKATTPRGKTDGGSTSSDGLYSDISHSEDFNGSPSRPVNGSPVERHSPLHADAQALAEVNVKRRAQVFGTSAAPDSPTLRMVKGSPNRVGPRPSYDESDGDIPLNTNLSKVAGGLHDDDGLSDASSSPMPRRVWESSLDASSIYDPEVSLNSPTGSPLMDNQSKRRSTPQAQLAGVAMNHAVFDTAAL
jgi:hypothetical protein